MESIISLLQSYGVPSAIAVAVATIVISRFPWLLRWLPAVAKQSETDVRPDITTALNVVADHGATMKCPKLRAMADSHCTALTALLIRRPGYSPADTEKQK